MASVLKEEVTQTWKHRDTVMERPSDERQRLVLGPQTVECQGALSTTKAGKGKKGFSP